MRKKRSLIVSLALAFVLMLSAPFALSFNKKETAKAEVVDAIDAVSMFTMTGKSTVTPDVTAYMTPKVATIANGLPAGSSYENKGVLVPFSKVGDEQKAKGIPDYGCTESFPLASQTETVKLFEFLPVISNWRSYRVSLTDGINAIHVYVANKESNNGAYGYVTSGTVDAIYVQAGGQGKIGGLSDGATGTFIAATTNGNGAIDVSAATGTPYDGSKPIAIYYNASEKAIYTNGANGSLVLVRDLDATDVTNGEDTAFAGLTGNVTIAIRHTSGGGYVASNIPTANTYGMYGVVVTALNDIDLTHNSFGYLASYALTGTTITPSAYKPVKKEVPINVANSLVLERVDGEDLASGEADGWTTTVYNASKEDVTATTLLGDVFTPTEVGNYVVYRTKTVDETTTYVTYEYSVLDVETGFENKVVNIFDTKATDGAGKAKVSLPVDLTTGTAVSTLVGEKKTVKLAYDKVPIVNETPSKATDYLNRSIATVKSVNISDNTKSDSLISLFVKDIKDIASLAVVVTEVADPSNGFVVSGWVGNATENMTRASANAFTQNPFGTRGSSSDKNSHTLAANGSNFATIVHKFAYDKAENAIYINDKLIRDFDATGADAWKNGANSNYEPNKTDPVWEGFKTDEVQVHIVTLVGAGDVYVSNLDGNDLSYALFETASGYTAGLVAPVKTDNYNATTFANIGESVVVPAPTSKLLTGDFVERTDITVATVKVNGGEAVAYEKGVTTFTAVAGINKIEYLDGSANVVATAYVKAYDKSLESEITGGSVSYGPRSLIASMTANNTIAYQVADGMAARVNASEKGVKITAQRPAVCDTEDNARVMMNLNKKIFVGDNDNTAPLVEFAWDPEYLRQQLRVFGIVISDGTNEIRITTEQQIGETDFGPSGNKQPTNRYFFKSIDQELTPIFVFVNGVKTNLRHIPSQLYNGNGFIAKNVYTAGYAPGKLSIYFDKATQTLSVGAGQSYGDNLILTHLNPSDADITTYKYPAGRPRFTLGDEISISFEFSFKLDADYEESPVTNTAPLSGKGDATMLLFNIDGQSLVQTNGVYANDGVKVARTVADDTNAYKVGDTITLPAVTEYFSFWAEGGVVAGTVDGYTVDVKDATGAVVYTDLAPNATFNADNFGTYTLVYKFSNRENIEKTIKVTTKTITLSANDVSNIAVDTTENSGLGGTLPNFTLTEDGFVNVKITPASGYAITSAKIDGVEQIVDLDLTGAQLSFMVAYADIANASTLEATVTAFADIKFSITYDANGGVLAGTAGTDYKVEYAYNDETFALPTTVTKTGYTFDGWFDGSGNKVEEIAQYSSTNYVLTARWTANAFTATFNSDGGTAVEDATIYYDGVVTEPTAPTKTGYDFLGWFIGETEYDFETLVTGDIELTAKWTIKTFAVTFDVDGGSTVDAQTINYGETATEPTAPTKTGYTFAGWFVGTEEYDFETAVTAPVSLTAKWTINTYTVTFNANGGSAVANATADYNTAVAEPTAPTKTGYDFLGWFIGETEYDFETLVTGDIELTAKWTIKTFAVTFDVDGGSAVDAQTINYGETATEPTAPTKTGYTFAGWFVGTEEYDFETAVTAPVSLTAKWTINTYTVTFNANGGSAVANATADYNTAVAEPTAPTKTGYDFLGWFIGETEYDFATLVTGDIELTAKWTIKTFAVTFNVDGGSAVDAQTINYGETATEPTAPTKTGYTFAGWFVGTEEYDFETAVTAPVSLTAKWTINTYTVTFNANGGSAVANATADYNTAVAEPTAPTKAGYEFAGWYADEALTTAWNFTEGKITADTTLYAKWTEVVVTPPADDNTPDDTTPDTTPDDTTPEDTTPDDKPAEKKGCGKEAAGLLAVVLSALAVVFVTKKR